MYFRKYFSGMIENNNTTAVIKNINTNGSLTIYANQSKVLCSAVFETLKEAGIPCEYDEETYVLNIDGISVQICSTNNSVNIWYLFKGIELNPSGSTGANYTPFNGNSVYYKCYITLKGDIDSVLKIYVGTYNAAASESYGIAIGKGIDLRDGKEIRVVNTAGYFTGNYSQGYIFKDDAVLADYNGMLVFGWQIVNAAAINNNGTEITLIEAISQSGRFKLNNCYSGNATLAADSFYNIGGDIYYAANNFLLVQCKLS